ncbi:MAG: hydroxymethylpyrimidine/phosphomethylpyrimidine kinase [Deltaproteobacteria bacterium]|nr:hydroxymethylpyrimidine/phosphomethylpyrimidine kinase [Deltaproteobacteria bacterium]
MAQALSCALAVGGLDPSGGAGLLADAGAFRVAGAWPCAVAAALTVQSTAGLRRTIPVAPGDVRDQLQEVLTQQRVCAWKTGALGSEANVEVVLEAARARPELPLVVDPVLLATRAPGGARLLDEGALDVLRALVATAALVTPNLDEAGALLGRPVRTPEEQREAARALVSLGARAALVKGGHGEGAEVLDVLVTGGEVTVLRGPRLPLPAFHGGGCALSALLTGWLATHEGGSLEAGVRWARERHQEGLSRLGDVGEGLAVLRLDA